MISIHFQVALKRQQAVENAIALRLIATKTGKRIDTLPEGQIFGLSTSVLTDGAEAGDAMERQLPTQCQMKPHQIQQTAEDLSKSSCGGNLSHEAKSEGWGDWIFFCFIATKYKFRWFKSLQGRSYPYMC